MSLLTVSIIVIGAAATAYCVASGLNKLRGPNKKFRRFRVVVEEPKDPEKD
jgi:hypothetical protein